MATTATTYLANPTVTIGAVDVTAMCSSAVLTVGYDSLEMTTFGDSGHLYTKGLQSVSVEVTLFDSTAQAPQKRHSSPQSAQEPPLWCSHQQAHLSRQRTLNIRSPTR